MQNQTKGLEQRLKAKIADKFGLTPEYKEGTYWHILTRVKESREIGTMSIDDFQEVTMEDLQDLVESILSEIKTAEKAVFEEILKGGKKFRKNYVGSTEVFVSEDSIKDLAQSHGIEL